jgi:uncharacterized protein YdaU (DUF1376 family)
MNFYPFHIGDYAAHTRHLSFMEDLAYRRLIDQYYLDECPLKGEPSLIARRIGMSDFSSDVQYILETFFEKEEDLWVSKRCDGEIAKYRLKADSARNANRIKSEKITALKSELKSEPNHIVTKNQEPRTNIKAISTPDGVSSDLWSDFLAYRKRLKAPVTDRVVTRLIKESKDANMTLEQVLETIIFKGWRSFEASWMKSDVKQVEKVRFL